MKISDFDFLRIFMFIFLFSYLLFGVAESIVTYGHWYNDNAIVNVCKRYTVILARCICSQDRRLPRKLGNRKRSRPTNRYQPN